MKLLEKYYWKKGKVYFILLLLMLLTFIGASVVITAFPAIILIFFFLYVYSEWKEKEKINSVDNYNCKVPSTYNGNQFMSAEEKATYLQSIAWDNLRKLTFFLANYKCQHCGSTDNLECHHTTYERLGNEKYGDLKCLCRKCHQAVHDKLGYDRTTHYPISILKEIK